MLLGMNTLFGQPGCPGVTVPDTTVCGSGCLSITANPVSGNQTNTYVVQSIPYSPFPQTGGNQVLLNIDDYYTPAIPLPFTFCFFGNSYNQMTIGSNGLVSFNMAYAGAGGPWAIGNAIPSPAEPVNSIMAPYHDIDPSISNPGLTLNWQVYGTAPCRVMVVNWYSIRMYSCNNLIATQQIALYETTNIIETYIQNKPLCSGWNSGAAIHGIQNATGTVAFVVPGRNYPTQWSTSNDGWAFIPNGAPNYTVNWFQQGNPVPVASTATATLCPTPGTSTNFICEVTYNNCGSGTVVVRDTTTITIQNAGFNVTATSTDVSCNGGSNGTATAVAANGITPYSYAWNSTPQQNVPNATNLPAGTYAVIVTDSAGCTATDTVVINQPPAITLSLSATNAQCFGANGSITATPGGGTGGFTYNWNTTPAQTGATMSAPAGTWTVTVTDGNGCSNSGSATITQPTQVTVSATSTPSSCVNLNDGGVNCTPAGGNPPYTFLWSPGGQTTQSVSNLYPGNYTVTVTDGNGCTGTTSVTVGSLNLLTVNIGPDVELCAGEEVLLDPGPGFSSIVWQDGSSGRPYIASVAGTYHVTVTDPGGCTASDTMVILAVHPLPVIDLGPDSVICIGETLPLDAGPGYASYQWQDGYAGQVYNATTIGYYHVTVTDQFGCQDRDTIRIPNRIPVPAVTLGNNITMCVGDTATLVAKPLGLWDYTWSTGATSQSITVTDAGTYWVTVSNRCGSEARSQTVLPLRYPPATDIGPDTFYCEQPLKFDAGLNPYSTFLWSNGNTSQATWVAQLGQVWVRVTNMCGEASDTLNIQDGCPPQLYFPNAFSPNGDNLNEFFFPVGETVFDFEMQVFDRWGKLLFITREQNNGWDGKDGGVNVPEGVYVWKASWKRLNLGQTENLHQSGSVMVIR